MEGHDFGESDKSPKKAEKLVACFCRRCYIENSSGNGTDTDTENSSDSA